MIGLTVAPWTPRIGVERSPFGTGLAWWLLRVLLVVLPATSFLLLPSVQGTTPANLVLLLMVFPISGIFVLGLQGYKRVTERLVPFVLCLGILFFASRYAYLDSLRELGTLNLVNPGFILPLTMVSHVTQSIYLLMGVLIYILASEYYETKWDKYIFFGAWLLVGYGFIDWLFQTAFHLNVDVLSNRVFEAGRFEHPGSLRQNATIAGLTMLRLKSFTGEPSMYALTALSYLPIAIFRGRTKLALALCFSLVLSLSTSAYLGLLLIGGVWLSKQSFERRVWAALILASAGVLVSWVAWDRVSEYLFTVLLSKFGDNSHSAIARSGLFSRHLNFWMASDWPQVVFGYGFGTVRSTDLLSTLLVNTGAAGVALVLGFVISVAGRGIELGRAFLAFSFIVIVALMFIAIPEFSYLPPWLLAGICVSRVGRMSEAGSHAI